MEGAFSNKWDSNWCAFQQCNVGKPILNNKKMRFDVLKR